MRQPVRMIRQFQRRKSVSGRIGHGEAAASIEMLFFFQTEQNAHRTVFRPLIKPQIQSGLSISASGKSWEMLPTAKQLRQIPFPASADGHQFLRRHIVLPISIRESHFRYYRIMMTGWLKITIIRFHQLHP